ncbi:unnamed protein product, partial [Discosporangium mesarthrocarpum]
RGPAVNRDSPSGLRGSSVSGTSGAGTPPAAPALPEATRVVDAPAAPAPIPRSLAGVGSRDPYENGVGLRACQFCSNRKKLGIKACLGTPPGHGNPRAFRRHDRYSYLDFKVALVSNEGEEFGVEEEGGKRKITWIRARNPTAACLVTCGRSECAKGNLRFCKEVMGHQLVLTNASEVRLLKTSAAKDRGSRRTLEGLSTPPPSLWSGLPNKATRGGGGDTVATGAWGDGKSFHHVSSVAAATG